MRSQVDRCGSNFCDVRKAALFQFGLILVSVFGTCCTLRSSCCPGFWWFWFLGSDMQTAEEYQKFVTILTEPCPITPEDRNWENE